MLYICERFLENILNGFQLIERTGVHGGNDYVQCSEGNNSNSRQKKLPFICSAHCLMMFYICVKFRENITNGIRVMERTPVHCRNGYFQYL